MFISLQELELRPVRFSVDIPAGEIDFVNPAVQTSVLHAAGHAELVSHALDGFAFAVISQSTWRLRAIDAWSRLDRG